MTFKPESLLWPDQLMTLQSLSTATRAKQKEALDLGDSQLTSLKAINVCFDAKAVQKVRLAAQNDPPYILSFSNAEALTGLKSKAKPDELHGLVHTALDIVLAQKLATKDIKNLVEWMVKDNPAETFNPSETKTDKRTAESQSKAGTLSSELKKIMEVAVKADAEINKGDGQTAAQDELKTLVEKMIEEAKKKGDSGKKEKEKKKSKSASGNPSDWFWEMLLGVKFVSQLRSRAKKGELTITDKVLVLLYFVFYKPFELLIKFLGKLFKGMAKDFGHWLKHTLGKTFSQIIQWAVPLIIIGVLIWGAGKVYQFVVANPLHWIESQVKSGFHADSHNESAQSSPVSQLVASTQMSSPQKSSGTSTSSRSQRASVSIVTYQPSIPFQPTAEDSTILEYEIDAIEPKSHVKDYSVTPDEGIPGDVAVSRVRDLADPDKYTMKIGKDKQTLLSANVTTTGITINYKSADVFNGLTGGGGGQWNVLWEDFKAIHVSEIVSETSPQKPGISSPTGTQNASITYQCSVIAEGAKIPFTLQCATTANLQHLVSALEYFIRNSRLGHDAQPGGLPYPTQGLRLNNDCVVDKLWAQSPADKAGVQLGDYLWSVGTITAERQEKKDLEAGLQTLPVTLFAASPAEWAKALTAARAPGQSLGFRPKLRKVALTAN